MEILNKKILSTVLLITTIIAVMFFCFFFSTKYINVTVIIPQGSGINQISKIMVESNLSSNRYVPYIVLGAGKLFKKNIKYGEYKFSGSLNLYKILKKLFKGEVLISYLTIPEGYTTMQIFELVKQNPKLFGEISVPLKDGILLPETYDYTYGDTKNSLIVKMILAQQNFLSGHISDNKTKLEKEQIVTLASIIQKEATDDAEMPIVSSVFHNRIKKNMPLQADPTVIYALTEGKIHLNRSLTKKDLEINSPYNTYKILGLTPAPICNPGKAAILAALRPEDTNYLYFVVNGSGSGHNFSASLSGHNDNVRQFRKYKNSIQKNKTKVSTN